MLESHYGTPKVEFSVLSHSHHKRSHLTRLDLRPPEEPVGESKLNTLSDRKIGRGEGLGLNLCFQVRIRVGL